MAHPLENLYVRPLFCIALNGEFNPVSDPFRSYTLARLMVATYIKGKKEYDLEGGISTYNPSWAPDITARATYDFNRTTVLASGLNLWRGDVTEVCIYDETDTGSSNLFVSAPGFEERFDLNLGEELDDARAAVTQVAKEYFS